ncbi:MAG TPA: M15 family metallopeptidase [Kofleriaceae bacterium]|jgi:poly-gamma-glutamate synthesis protein (capsule biosynthesis protein)|nr:M15 family metallopeptidase [Kofleriaceae bacterium]
MSALVEPPQSRFTGAWRAIPDDVRARMHGVAWKDDPRCPSYDALAYVEVDHLRFDGEVAKGELVVARAIADDTIALCARLYAIGFPIRAMQLVDDFGADDDRSMSADNCSAFNFRVVAGTDVLSQHALGLAIDINPVENPWVRPGKFVPPEGEPFLRRDLIRTGMIVRPGPVTAIFDELGWEWGGDWRHASDYHHIVKRH